VRCELHCELCRELSGTLISVSAVLGCTGDGRTLGGAVRMLLGAWPSRAVEPDVELQGFEWYPVAKGISLSSSLIDMLSGNCTREFGGMAGRFGLLIQ